MYQKQSSNKEKSHGGNTGQNNDSGKDNSGTYAAFIGVGATSMYGFLHAIPYIDSSISLSQYAREYFYGKDDSKSILPEEDLKVKKSNADLMREHLEERQRIDSMIEEADKKRAAKRTNNKSDYVSNAVKNARAAGHKEAQAILAEYQAMADEEVKKRVKKK